MLRNLQKAAPMSGNPAAGGQTGLAPKTREQDAGLPLFGMALLLVTIFGWGLNWPVMKFLLAEWPPLLARGTSGLAAGLGIAIFARIRGESLAVPEGSRVRMLVAALFNVTAWMGLASLAMSWLSVGEAAMIIYTMPIWANILAWPISGVRPTTRSVLALVLGMCGIAVLLAGQGLEMTSQKLAGIVCAFSAAVMFAISTVTVRPPAGVAPLGGTAWQLMLGSLPMILAGILIERPQSYALSAIAAWSWLYMAVVAMAICYFCWFAALRRLPPTTASLGMMLIPVIGTISAAFMLGEPFGMREVLALALVVGGIALALVRR